MSSKHKQKLYVFIRADSLKNLIERKKEHVSNLASAHVFCTGLKGRSNKSICHFSEKGNDDVE